LLGAYAAREFLDFVAETAKRRGFAVEGEGSSLALIELLADTLEAKARSMGFEVESRVREGIMNVLDDLEDYLELYY